MLRKKAEPEYGNSNGFFKDPSNGQDLSAATPRSSQASLDGTRFMWPLVRFADGSEGKIVYKYFTPEEKQLYGLYREMGKDRPKTGNQKRSMPASDKELRMFGKDKAAALEAARSGTHPQVEQVEVVWDPEAANSASSLRDIKMADYCIMTQQIAGLTYAFLVQESRPNVFVTVPRALINKEEAARLGC